MERYTANDGYTERDLYLFAEGHLRACELLFKSGPEYYDSAAFLGHLAIELALKMHLLHRTGSFPNGHNLVKLVRDAQQAAAGIEITDDGRRILKRLNKFVNARYPNPQDPVEVGDADFKYIDAYCDGLLRACSAELRGKIATSPKPGLVTKGRRVLMKKRIEKATST